MVVSCLRVWWGSICKNKQIRRFTVYLIHPQSADICHLQEMQSGVKMMENIKIKSQVILCLYLHWSFDEAVFG